MITNPLFKVLAVIVLSSIIFQVLLFTLFNFMPDNELLIDLIFIVVFAISLAITLKILKLKISDRSLVSRSLLVLYLGIGILLIFDENRGDQIFLFCVLGVLSYFESQYLIKYFSLS